MGGAIKIIDYMAAFSEILQLLKTSEGGQIRKNVRLASRKLRKFKKTLKKDGFEPWEKELYEDLIKVYAKQLKKLMAQ